MKDPQSSDPEQLRARLSMLDEMNEGMQILDGELRYVYINRAAARHGRRAVDELVGRTLPEMYPGVEQTEMFRRLCAVLEDRQPRGMENLFEFSDGTQRWFELRMEPVPEGVMVLSIDIHQRKSLEEELRRAQKLEAVGRLAGGIAHDFNNLLTVIGSCVEIAELRLGARSLIQRELEQIELAVSQGGDLTRQLVSLTRRQPQGSVPVHIDGVLEQMEPMIRRVLGQRVELEMQLGDPGVLRLAPGQLEQALLNLVLNARDAMPRGGSLQLGSEGAPPDVLGGGARVACLRVRDTGCGMDAPTRERIFEPFFTTRAEQGGSGLGLDVVRRVVRAGGGRIELSSEPGRGTEFRLYFPVVADTASADLPHAPRADEQLNPSTSVVVALQSAELRDLCQRILEAHGLQTRRWSEGDLPPAPVVDRPYVALVEVSRDAPERVRRLRLRCSELPVLGIGDVSSEAHLGDLPGVRTLYKPFTATGLIQALAALISEASDVPTR